MAIVYGVIYGHRPWDSLDSTREQIEPQERIDKCLCCEYAECCNCLSGRKEHIGSRQRRRKIDLDVVAELFATGMTVTEVAGVLGVTRQTAARYRKEMI